MALHIENKKLWKSCSKLDSWLKIDIGRAGKIKLHPVQYFLRGRRGEEGEGAGGAPSLVKGRAVGYEARPVAKDNSKVIL